MLTIGAIILTFSALTHIVFVGDNVQEIKHLSKEEINARWHE